MKRWVLPILVGTISLMSLAGDSAANQQLKAEIRVDLSSNKELAQPLDQIWQQIRAAQQSTRAGDRPSALATLNQVVARLTSVQDPTRRAQAIAALAAIYADLGEYDQGITLANTLTYDTYASEYCCIPLRAEAEIAIVQAYVRAGKFEQAKQLTLSVQPQPFRNQILVPVISEFANQGQFEDAIALSNRIANDDEQKGRAEFRIVQAYANRKRFEEGLAFTRTLRDASARGNLQLQLIEAAARVGQYDQAERMTQQLDVIDGKIQALTKIALAMAAVGQQTQALSLLSQAYQLTQTNTEQLDQMEWVRHFATIGAYDRALEITTRLNDPYIRGESTIAIAKAYANAGDYEKALELAQTVQEGTLRPFADLPDPKLEVLGTLVKRATKAGRDDFALQVVQAFEKPEDRIISLRTIAGHYRLTNQPDQATATLLQAAEIAKTVNAVTIRIDRNTSYSISNAPLLIDVAQDLAKLGDTKAAIAILDRALTSAQQFDYTSNSYQHGAWSAVPLKTEALTEIALAYAELKQSPQAVPILQEAVQLAATIEDISTSTRVDRLVAIAKGFAAIGEQPQARQVLAQAHSSSAAMGASEQQLRALGAIAQGYAAIDQSQDLATVINQFLQQAATLEPTQKDAQLQQFAVTLAAANSPDAALEMIERIQTNEPKIEAIIQTAAEYLKNNQPNAADRVLSQLRRVSDQAWGINQGDIRLNEKIVNYYVIPGYWQHPLWQYELATRLNETIQSLPARATNGATIALGYAVQGEPEQARQILRKAIATAQDIEPASDQLAVLLQAFEQAIQAEQPELALLIAQSFEEAPYQVNALRQVAQQYSLLRQPERVVEVLSQAKQAASRILDPAERERVLQAIAQQQR